MEKFYTEPLRQLHYWIRERQSIADKKLAGLPPPWTKDPVMANTRWCNVRRMDDKVSEWLLANWYPHNVSRPTIMAAVGLARLFNWPESLDGLRAPRSGVFNKWDRAKADEHFHKIKTNGGKVFTGVYIINGALGGRGSDKIETVLGQIDVMHNNAGALIDNTSMEATWRHLQTVDGIGSFMAGQMVADLRHVWPGLWADRMRWAPLGPGSQRGMAWLHGWDGVEELKRMPQEQFVERINALLSTLMNNRAFQEIHDRLKLELHDIQNCLCEMDKYMRLKTGTGKARNGYIAKAQLELV